MKYLVTGANGFLGKHLCRYFEQTGTDYVAATRFSQGPKEIPVGDLLEFRNWQHLFKEIDVVVHLAAKVHDIDQENSVEYRKLNVELTKRVAFEAKRNGVKRFVFLSSIKVNGEKTNEIPFTADDIPNPQDLYALSKLEAENELLKLNDKTFEIVIIRPPLIYGRNVKANFSRLVSLVRKKIPLPFGLINNKRSLISALNLTHLIKVAAEHPKAAGHIFLASDGKDISTKELIFFIAKTLNIETLMVPVPPKIIHFFFKIFKIKYYEDRLFSNLQVDIQKTKELLSWHPPFTIEESIKLMLDRELQLEKLNCKPKVAVLLATYNGMKFLEPQIRSILDQADVEVTLFISDDFSTDGTWEFLQSAKSNRIKVLERKVQYRSASGNFFRLLQDVDFSSFDFISLSDQDDIWFIDKLRTSVIQMEAEQAVACSSDVIAFWESKKKQKYIRKSRPMGKWNHLFESAGPGCTYVFRKDIAVLFSSFLQKRASDISAIKNTHDWVLFSFVVSNNFKWIIIDAPTMMYRQHSNNSFGANTGLNGVSRRLKMIVNGWYLNEVFAIAQVCKNLQAEPLQRVNTMRLTDLFYLVKNLKEMRRNRTDRIVLCIYFLYLFLQKIFLKPHPKGSYYA